MQKYAFNPKNSVKIYGRGLRISRKSSVVICSKMTGMNFEKGKAFLARLLEKKESLGGRYYTNTAKELAKLMNLAESSAEFKGMDTSRMLIHASAHRGFTFYRPRAWKNRRTKRKSANLQIVLHNG